MRWSCTVAVAVNVAGVDHVVTAALLARVANVGAHVCMLLLHGDTWRRMHVTYKHRRMDEWRGVVNSQQVTLLKVTVYNVSSRYHVRCDG